MPIVTTIVSQQVAPLPETLQQMGAIISVGATTLSPGGFSFLTQLSDLTPLLRGASALSTLSWSGGVVTATTTNPHGLTNGAVLDLIVAGATPAGYNGAVQATVTDASTFTYPLTVNPGLNTVPGTFSNGYNTRLVAAVTTWFSQGNLAQVAVLELGPNTTATPYLGEIATLTAYLVANPNSAYTPGALGYFYAYLVPPGWDALPAFLALAATYEGNNALTYFFTTTTLATYSKYTNLMKSVFAEIESPSLSAYPTVALTSLVRAGGTVTGSTTVAHGVSPGNYFQLSGSVPVAYNGWFLALPGTTGNVLVYGITSTPTAATTLGSLVGNSATSTGVPANEFTTAASMYDVISNRPSSSNRVPPLDFTFQFGVTPFPQLGLSSLFATLATANINYVGTGSEGGISTATLFGGNLMNGDDFIVWYSIDAAQLYANINLSNAVINGSNNHVNPLYYSQDGINRLQDVAVSTMGQLVSFGLANGRIVSSHLSAVDFIAALDAGTYNGIIVVNAEPFVPYLRVNPSDYRLGRYAGLTVQYIASRGFRSIVFNLLVTSFVVGA